MVTHNDGSRIKFQTPTLDLSDIIDIEVGLKVVNKDGYRVEEAVTVKDQIGDCYPVPQTYQELYTSLAIYAQNLEARSTHIIACADTWPLLDRKQTIYQIDATKNTMQLIKQYYLD